MFFHRLGVASCLAITVAACASDRITSGSALDESRQVANGVSPSAAALMSNYVAIGTSVSMGWRSDGITGAEQAESWPAVLAADVGVPFSVPSIQAPGCKPMIAAPLINFKRTDGTPSLVDSRVCALS